MTTTDKETLDKKRRLAFLKCRGKFDLENKGIDAFNDMELKKFYDLEVISKHVYKR